MCWNWYDYLTIAVFIIMYISCVTEENGESPANGIDPGWCLNIDCIVVIM